MKNSPAISTAKFLVTLGLIVSYLRLAIYFIFFIFLIIKPANLPSFFSNTNMEEVYLNIKDLPFLIIFLNLLGFFARIGLTLAFLKNCQKLLKNLAQEQIFIQANVTLAKNSSLALGLMSVLQKFGWRQFSFKLDTTALLAALLIWIFALILEKAKQIAEENAFTI